MARTAASKLDVPLVRGIGAFRQSLNRVLDSDQSARLDSETYDALIEFNDSIEKFEDFLLTRRMKWFFTDKLVMFDGSDFV